MKIIDILNGPWAIMPDMLREIQGIYAAHLHGEKIDLKAVEAVIGKPLNNETKPYQVQNDVAIIPVHGVIAKRMNLFTQISGGVSTQLLINDVNDAGDDPDIQGIVLDVDTPGGTVDGTEDAANVVYETRAKKPIVTWSDGSVLSGGLWIGSASEKFYISGQTQPVGSLGVVTTHVDYSEYEKRKGIKTTEIYAGKYKRITSEYKPLSKEGLTYRQDQVDYLYSIFVEAVARNRSATVDRVLSDMAAARVFTGRQAITAGLVDGIASLDEVVNSIIPSMVEDRKTENDFSALERSL